MRRCGKWSESPRVAQPTSHRRMVSAVLLLGLSAFMACAGDEEPPPPVPLEDRSPKVLVIGIDGVRPDVLAEVATPNLDGLALSGMLTVRTRTTTPSVSGPAWSSMLTGVWPEKHGVTDNEFTGRRYDEFPDFLTRIEQTRPDLATFAAVDWLPLMEIDGGGPTISDRVDVRETLDGYQTGWAEGDTEVVSRAVRHLRTADPDALFVYLGNPDEASHQAGSVGIEYREAIALADRHVGLLIDAIRSRPSWPAENWLVVVSTDHGRRADGGHGGNSPEEMTTFILVSGPAAALGPPAEATHIVDVASTALVHLGIPIDPAWGLDGRPVGLR